MLFEITNEVLDTEYCGENAGYVYFVKADGVFPYGHSSYGRYKIGRTNNLERRMGELNGQQQPTQNLLLFAIAVRDTIEVEKLLHEKFAEYRDTTNPKSIEWFNFLQRNEYKMREVFESFEEEFGVHIDPYADSFELEDRYRIPLSHAGLGVGSFFVGLAIATAVAIGFVSFSVPQHALNGGATVGFRIDASANGSDGAFFRSAPSQDAGNVVGVIGNGQTISILDDVNFGEWVKVGYDGAIYTTQGWVTVQQEGFVHRKTVAY